MIFVPKIIDNYTIDRVQVDGIGRHYQIKLQDGSTYLMPSVTTLLSLTKTKEMENILKNWRKSVGEKHAYAISNIATDDGEMLHYFCELIMLRKYQEAQTYYKECKSKRARFFMKKIFPNLKKYKIINASEEFMFSLKYNIAGTTDAVVEHDGIEYILDFKTSKSIKDPKDIEDYYIQTSAYALMWEELTGRVIEDAIILIVNPYNTQEVIVNLKEYKVKFVEKLNEFYDKFGKDYLKDFV